MTFTLRQPAMKTLIVDDNAADRKILRYLLERHGGEIVEAADGEEALTLARRERPALIISDALMPRMDGFQLLRRIKGDAELRAIPFIFYSSVYTGKMDEDLALALGAAQRLVRLNCTHCAHPLEADEQLLAESGLTAEQVRNWDLRAGRGCGHCRGTGFRGRKAIAEIMVLNDEIRELIVAREPIRRVKDAARRGGTRFLRESALDVVRAGVTSLQEINRVTLVG